MIKKRLELIRGLVSSLGKKLFPDADPKIELGVATHILELIHPDLTKIALKDPTFLDGLKGHVDYYSPHAEAQIKNKQEILEKYLNNLNVVQAVLLCISKMKKEEQALTDNNILTPVEKEKKLLELKGEIDSLMRIKDPKELLTRIDVQNEMAQLNEINTARKELKETELKLKRDDEVEEEEAKLDSQVRAALEQKKGELQSKIKKFDDALPEVNKKVKEEIDKLQIYLTINQKLAVKIPRGMLDVKRALTLVQELVLVQKTIEIKRKALSDLEEGDPKIEGLQKEIVKLELKERALSSIKFNTSEDVDKKIKEMLKDLQGLMASSIKAYQALAVTGGDFNAYLHKTTAFYWENLYLYRKTLSTINDYIKNAGGMTVKGTFLSECIDKAFEQIPKEEDIHQGLNAVKKVDGKLKLRKEAYDAKIDNHAFRFYRTKAENFITAILNTPTKPLFFLPYNPGNYVLDHPAHSDYSDTLGNCYGETQMFLQRINGKKPTINNICPETDLLNFQLDQSRKPSGENAKILGRFPKPEDQQKEKVKVTWDAIKDLLTKEVDSKKNGDLCYLKLDGATVAGHDATVSHIIGLIKMKDPSPYKYVVYDYGFGATGFSDDEQLGLFFKEIFDVHVPFYKCFFEKVGEVSDECCKFVSGIQPLEKPKPEATCERSYWNKERLVLLAKYSKGDLEDDVKLILEKIEVLKPDEQKAVFDAVFANKQISLDKLLPLSVTFYKDKKKDSEFFKRVVEQVFVLGENITFKFSGEVPRDMEAKVVKLIDNKQRAELACRIFPQQKAIIVQAFSVDPTSLQFANLKLLKTWFTQDAIKPDEACKALPENKEIILAAYAKKPMSIKFADLSVVKELVIKKQINYGVAATAFDTDVWLINGNSLLNLNPLTKESTKEEKKSRIQFLIECRKVLDDSPLKDKSLDDKFDTFTKQICLLLHADISPKPVDITPKDINRAKSIDLMGIMKKLVATSDVASQKVEASRKAAEEAKRLAELEKARQQEAAASVKAAAELEARQEAERLKAAKEEAARQVQLEKALQEATRKAEEEARLKAAAEEAQHKADEEAAYAQEKNSFKDLARSISPEGDLRGLLQNIQNKRVTQDDRDDVHKALVTNKPILGALLKLVMEESRDMRLLEQILKQPYSLTGNLSYQEPLDSKDPCLIEIIDFISTGKITAEVACKVFANNSGIVLAAYNKDPAVLNRIDSAIVPSLISLEQGKISPEAACAAFKTNEHVILAAYEARPNSIKNADFGNVRTLVQQEKINLKHAVSVFPENKDFQTAFSLQLHLNSLHPLPALSADKQLNARVDLLAKMSKSLATFSIDSISEGIDVLAKNVCHQLMDKINDLSPHEVKPESFNTLKGSQLTDMMTTLTSRNVELTQLKAAQEVESRRLAEEAALVKAAADAAERQAQLAAREEAERLKAAEEEAARQVQLEKALQEATRKAEEEARLKAVEEAAQEKRSLIELAGSISTVEGIREVLGKITSLQNLGDKDEVYQALFANESILDQLIKFAVEENKVELLQLLKHVDSGLIETLVQEGKVTIQDAASAFAMNDNFKMALSLQQNLASLSKLAENSSDEAVDARVQLLTQMSQSLKNFSIDSLGQSIDDLAKDVGQQLIKKINALSPKDAVNPEALNYLKDEQLMVFVADLSKLKVTATEEVAQQAKLELARQQEAEKLKLAEEARQAQLEIDRQEAKTRKTAEEASRKAAEEAESRRLAEEAERVKAVADAAERQAQLQARQESERQAQLEAREEAERTKAVEVENAVQTELETDPVAIGKTGEEASSEAVEQSDDADIVPNVSEINPHTNRYKNAVQRLRKPDINQPISEYDVNKLIQEVIDKHRETPDERKSYLGNLFNISAKHKSLKEQYIRDISSIISNNPAPPAEKLTEFQTKTKSYMTQLAKGKSVRYLANLREAIGMQEPQNPKEFKKAWEEGANEVNTSINEKIKALHSSGVINQQK